MILLRLLNPQGIAGLAAAFCLALLLILQKGETRHWKKQSSQFEQLYRDQAAAFDKTVADYRAAADIAAAADRMNAERVVAEQRAINERTSNDFATRLADARARFERLRTQAASAPADPGSRAGPPVPGVSASSPSAAQAAGKDGLPGPDALLATEQAIQLDELIKWVRAQAKVDNNGSAVASPPTD